MRDESKSDPISRDGVALHLGSSGIGRRIPPEIDFGRRGTAAANRAGIEGAIKSGSIVRTEIESLRADSLPAQSISESGRSKS